MQKGISGRKITSRSNGNSIFLPAAGGNLGTVLMEDGLHGHYWSSSLCQDNDHGAWYVYFDSEDVVMDYERRLGLTVRAVCQVAVPTGNENAFLKDVPSATKRLQNGQIRIYRAKLYLRLDGKSGKIV